MLLMSYIFSSFPFLRITLCLKVSKVDSEPETKEALLEDHDSIWLELRHAHIADVSSV
jgi:hypothetical protein